MKIHFFVFVALTALTLSIAGFTQVPLAEAGENNLRVNQTSVKPGEAVIVRFTTQSGLASNAWIGIIPASVPHGNEAVNDNHDVAYKYLQGKVKGSFQFVAPVAPGQYDLRLHDTDNNGRELAYVSFTVAGSSAATGHENSLDMTERSYSPGAAMTVRFTAQSGLASNAWVGIIPSSIAHGQEQVNDQHDLAYKYLKGATQGNLQFKAPGSPGSYDLRMHDTDNNGRELTHITFTVR